MKIIEKNIDDLREYENNPRNNDQAVDAVAASIDAFGFKVPIIIDRNNVIVAGHTRLKAARKLGKTKVPCVVADDLTDDQVKAFRLADNKTAELAEWNFDKLEKELYELRESGVDMEGFGFEFDEEVNADDYGEEFDLPSGDRHPVQTMTFTFSDDEAEIVKEAIQQMKQSNTFKQYENPQNENGNGRALYLVVSEWQAQRI